MRPFEAALKGAGQIGFTIISITFSLIAVFIPLFFMGGIIGRLFREFADHRLGRGGRLGGRLADPDAGHVLAVSERSRGCIRKGRFNRGGRARLRGGAAGATTAACSFVFRHQFVGAAVDAAADGRDRLSLREDSEGIFPAAGHRLHLRRGRHARRTPRFARPVTMAHEVVDIVRTTRASRGVFMLAGAYAYNPTENTARIFFALKPYRRARPIPPSRSSSACAKKVAAVEGAKFFMQVPQNITVGGRLSRTQYQYTLTDTDDDELNHWAPILEGEMHKLPELQDVASDQQIAAPHHGDRDRPRRRLPARHLASLIDQTLYDAFGQRQVATIYTATNQYKVVLEVQPQFQNDPNALSKIYVSGPNGAQVPLSTLCPFHLEGRAAVGQPSGRLPGGDPVVQPGARRRARPGGRQDPGDDRRGCTCRRR